jgi:hypothetical protein
MWTMETPDRDYFTAEERAQVDVLFKSLVPGDPKRGIPGAEAAGAVNMLTRLLAMSAETYVEIPAWRELYRNGLKALDAASNAMFGKQLPSLDQQEATTLLSKLEKAQIPGLPANLDQALFFKTLWRHCLQGCFADARWGGNQDNIMWRWMGYLQQPEEV